MLIDIFHDTACPWCYIGNKHLFNALAQWRSTAVNIQWHPFILDETIPPQGCEFHAFMQKRKNIGLRELQLIFDYTQQAGEAAGIKLDFNNISLAVNTKLSHQLIALAPAKIKHTVVEAIYKAYFEDALNIGERNILVAIGATAGMDVTNLQLQMNNNATLDANTARTAFARFNGITSVPFFIINNKVRIDGSHSVKVFRQALHQAVNPKV